jgi:hypothetical protein
MPGLPPMLSTLPGMLMDHGLHLGGVGIPWSVVLLVAIVVIGLLLIRAAITLVKVAILVGIGVAVYLLVQFVLNNFG